MFRPVPSGSESFFPNQKADPRSTLTRRSPFTGVLSPNSGPSLVRLQMSSSTAVTVLMVFMSGSQIFVQARPSGDDDMTRENRAPPSTCKPTQHHHEAFGSWATRPNDTHKLSLMAPSLHHHSFRTISEDDMRESEILAGSTDCPATPIFSPDEPIMGRSLCPWYWKVNFSATRIPAMLPEAVCRCRRAVTGINGVVVYECQPLTMHIRVLQLDAECKHYHERTIEMAVACVSVVQSSMRLNKIAGIEQTGHPQLLQQANFE